jgi:GTP pyrophosphokinase
VNVGELVTKIREYNPAADVGMVERAYDFSAKVHRGQTRLSGEPFLTHPLAVAGIIAEMRLDVPTVVTGLLHDTVEDTLTTLDEIDASFGAEVAALVDGVTKISLMESESRAEAEARSIRKMFIASARDIRVLLVKLADRAHNLRTIAHLPEGKQQRMAQETLDIYAPLAHRLGIYWLKSEFEDVAFKVLQPLEHSEISDKLALRRVQREGYIKEITSLLSKRLKEAGIQAEVTGRSKSAFSIQRKIAEQGLQYDEVYDVVAFRVLVDTLRECYDALGVVHTNWRPVPGRFRDYVALPKANMYQSLHTTVIGPYGARMEVQIRTHEMHRVAEFGIAAHWKYKVRNPDASQEVEHFEWLQQLLDWQQHFEDPQEYLHTVKQDLFRDEVIVFTPKGEPITLPKGSTVVDFAYRIHSEVGNHCTAARVSGQLVPLRYQLEPGDTVEVITTADEKPSRDWLKFVVTPRAREKISSFIRQEERGKAIKLGRELIERDLARWQIDLARLHREGRMADLLRHFQRSDEDSLFEALGYGRIRTKQVIEYLLPETAAAEAPRPRAGLRRLFGLLERSRKEGEGVLVRGIEDEMVRFGKCCEPLPGERITGFLTRGRGVTVHSSDCERLAGSDRERHVEVGWEKGARAPRTVRMEVISRDRPGLLAAMSHGIASAGINIDRAWVRTTGDGDAFNIFEMTLFSVEDLERVTRALRRVAGIKDVKRVRT